MPTNPFPALRRDFPSLGRLFNNKPLVYLDGPGGTQIPGPVVDAMTDYYYTHNANTHGQFVTTMESDLMMTEMRSTVASFLGAADGSSISIGANMTTLAFALSRAFARKFKAGDEVVVSQLDHEANRGPWLTLQEQGIVIREIRLLPNGTLDEDDMRKQITSRTKLVCIGMASNALGTVNNVALARECSARAGAWLLLDAVHYAPHFLINVGSLQPDFLLCSAYKFYGPHVGILYARPGLLEELEPDRLRTQDQHAPSRIETGTLNHAALAGVKAAIEYIANLGEGASLRSRLLAAMQRLGVHEREMAQTLYERLSQIRGVRVQGPDFSTIQRAPTVSFVNDFCTPEELCRRLGAEGFCCWDGHFYALRAMEVLGLEAKGGVTRMGVSMYNTMEEIERVIDAVERNLRP